MENVTCVKPKGTFYLFLDISNLNMDSLEFACDFLEKKHVAVVPGEAYGENYKNFVRIAFTQKVEVLEKAINLLEEYVNEMHKSK